jgi:hypothetical protein
MEEAVLSELLGQLVHAEVGCKVVQLLQQFCVRGRTRVRTNESMNMHSREEKHTMDRLLVKIQ